MIICFYRLTFPIYIFWMQFREPKDCGNKMTCVVLQQWGPLYLTTIEGQSSLVCKIPCPEQLLDAWEQSLIKFEDWTDWLLLPGAFVTYIWCAIILYIQPLKGKLDWLSMPSLFCGCMYVLASWSQCVALDIDKFLAWKNVSKPHFHVGWTKV